MINSPYLRSTKQITLSAFFGAGASAFWNARSSQILSTKEAAIFGAGYGIVTSVSRVAVGQDASYARNIAAFLCSAGLSTFFLLKAAPLLASRYQLLIPEIPHLLPFIALSAIGQPLIFSLIPSNRLPTIPEPLHPITEALKALEEGALKTKDEPLPPSDALKQYLINSTPASDESSFSATEIESESIETIELIEKENSTNPEPQKDYFIQSFQLDQPYHDDLGDISWLPLPNTTEEIDALTSNQCHWYSILFNHDPSAWSDLPSLFQCKFFERDEAIQNDYLSIDIASKIADSFEAIENQLSPLIKAKLLVSFYQYSLRTEQRQEIKILFKLLNLKECIECLKPILMPEKGSQSLSPTQLEWQQEISIHELEEDLSFWKYYSLDRQIYLKKQDQEIFPDYHFGSDQLKAASDEAISTLCESGFFFDLNWLKLSRSVQQELISRFAHIYEFPPCHPKDEAETQALSIEEIKSYYRNFDVLLEVESSHSEINLTNDVIATLLTLFYENSLPFNPTIQETLSNELCRDSIHPSLQFFLEQPTSLPDLPPKQAKWWQEISKLFLASNFPVYHPKNTSEVEALSVDQLKAYYENFIQHLEFYYKDFDQNRHIAENTYDLLQAFRKRFIAMDWDLLQTIPLSKEEYSLEELFWIKVIFEPELLKGLEKTFSINQRHLKAKTLGEIYAIWKRLSHTEQLNLKKQAELSLICKEPTPEELDQLNQLQLETLREQYERNPYTWVLNDPKYIASLNKAFVEANLSPIERKIAIQKLTEKEKQALVLTEEVWSYIPSEDQEVFRRLGLGYDDEDTN